MYEIIIIVCLAIALFLLLRHYPEARSVNTFSFHAIRDFLARFKRTKSKKEIQQIEKMIEESNENWVAPAEIERATETFHESDPELAQSLMKAEEAYEINDLRAAEELSLEVIGKDKRCAYAYLLIGKVAYSRGQFDDAREALRTTIKCKKDFAEAYFYLGLLESREENLSKAVEYLEKAVAHEKGHADWYAELGKVYMGVRQFAKAAKVLKRAASLDIDNKEYKDLAAEAEEKQRTHSFYARFK